MKKTDEELEKEREEKLEKELEDDEKIVKEETQRAKEQMELGNILTKKEKESKKKDKILKKKNLLIIILVVIIVAIILIVTSKESKVEINIKSTLERIVEKSDLETVTINYNIISKKCKDDNNCDKTSNNIDDFEYVVSCKATVNAGIDFKDVVIDVNNKEKKVVVEVPEATIKDSTIISVKFLNGDDLPPETLTEATKLCDVDVLERSKKDEKIVPAAKDQARVVLEGFYQQWIKAYDSSYTVEVR